MSQAEALHLAYCMIGIGCVWAVSWLFMWLDYRRVSRERDNAIAICKMWEREARRAAEDR